MQTGRDCPKLPNTGHFAAEHAGQKSPWKIRGLAVALTRHYLTVPDGRSHSMLNEMAKLLIFQYFPYYSTTDTLKNTLASKIRYCRFVAAAMGDTSPLARTCHQILLGDNAFISAQLQSKRSDKFKDTPICSTALSPCHSRNITPAIATETKPWHAFVCQPRLPSPTSPPLFRSRARRPVEP